MHFCEFCSQVLANVITSGILKGETVCLACNQGRFEGLPNMSFGSACKEKSKWKPRCGISKKLNKAGYSIAAAFIQSINNDNHCLEFGKSGPERIDDEIFDLVTQAFVARSWMACESTLHRRLYCWKELGKLVGKCGEKLGGIAAIFLASRKEKTESKLAIIGALLRDGMSDCRLSRASRALKPAYRAIVS